MRDNDIGPSGREGIPVQSDFNELETALLAASRATGPAVPLPKHEPSVSGAYNIQRRLISDARMPIMVWKLGLTGAGKREVFGASEPIVGRLCASAIYSDRSEIAYAGIEMFAEAELVFEMGQDLPLQDAPYSREDVCAALKGIYAGIEIVRTRFASSDLTLPLLIADNSMAHGLVLGRKLAAQWDDRFTDMPVTLTRGTDEAVEGGTALVMGNPLDAVVWLANWLPKNEGCTLQREQLIASGTCTGATEIFAGDTIRVEFDGVDAARISLRVPN
ncbi:MAG: fumarylacetoacetate hydrolase family protein [Sphingobium sp.]